MNNRRTIPIYLINLVVIISIMAVISMLTQNIITELTLNDIQNLTRLTQIDIYSELMQEFMDPINTSRTMAQSTLLFDSMNDDTPETEQKMAAYLSSIQNNTGYDSVFLIPHSTLNYYHPGGTDAKVNLQSDDSFWYKNRIDSDEVYSIVVNTEQLDNWALTIYANANIYDDEGNFAGVTGVGKRITYLQDILARFTQNQGVEAYLINEEGQIQVHPNALFIQSSTFHDLEGIDESRMNFKNSKSGTLEKMIDNRYFIIQYIEVLDWYLVVTKITSDLIEAFNSYSMRMYTALTVAVLIMMLATSFTITRYKKQIIVLSNIDQLTNIPNRTIFETTLREATKNTDKQCFCLALVDLDNLKLINDQFGHDKGDYALKHVSNLARMKMKEADVICRVGGDEFAMIFFRPLDASKSILMDFQESINVNGYLEDFEMTVSIGLTESMVSDTVHTIYKRADKALYQSKETGRNKVSSIVKLEE